MIEGRTVLAVIPARGGSKGLPGKNLRPLNGRPLIAWTIAAASAAATIDRLILSSDDAGIIATAERLGCESPFPRPAHLAADDTPSMAVIHHLIDALPVRYDYFLLLQPTSPLRLAADIDAAMRLCVEREAPAVVSVAKADKIPHWMYGVGEDGRLQPVIDAAVTRRQDMAGIHCLNGAIFAARTDWLRERASFIAPETVAYVMPKERSVDIDDALDLRIAEMLMREGTAP